MHEDLPVDEVRETLRVEPLEEILRGEEFTFEVGGDRHACRHDGTVARREEARRQALTERSCRRVPVAPTRSGPVGLVCAGAVSPAAQTSKDSDRY